MAHPISKIIPRLPFVNTTSVDAKPSLPIAFGPMNSLFDTLQESCSPAFITGKERMFSFSQMNPGYGHVRRSDFDVSEADHLNSKTITRTLRYGSDDNPLSRELNMGDGQRDVANSKQTDRAGRSHIRSQAAVDRGYSPIISVCRN